MIIFKMKMWSFTIKIILICVCCIIAGCASVSKNYCDHEYKGFGFNQSEIGMQIPAKNFSGVLLNSTPPVLSLAVTNRSTDFNLTVFFIPNIKDKSDCPIVLNGTENLRQYHQTCPVYKNNNESIPLKFYRISTGCYYYIATNAKGNNWQQGPEFYKTSHPYFNTALEFKYKTDFKPETEDSPMELRFSLKIPLSCILVRVQLFQFDGNITALADIRKKKIPGSQECWFTKNGTEVQHYKCKGSNLITNLTLEVTIEEDNGEEWIADVSWKKLRRGGGTYYLWVGSYTADCESRYGDFNIIAWKPIKRDFLEELGFEYLPPPEPTDDPQNEIIIYIICVSLGVILLAIFAYWKWKYLMAFRRNLQNHKTLSELPESVPLCESKFNILLMYARDSDVFMREMDTLQSLLERACNCRVHGLYAANEWSLLASLGVADWVEKQLRDGNKIVWVDTPEFRSRSIDQSSQNFSDDFRDAAIPYAVNLAKDLFQNVTTQYCYHFVVRVKGFEVNDELPDPLLSISPYTRYRIPDHLSLLCKHLKVSPEHLEQIRHEESEICSTQECESCN